MRWSYGEGKFGPCEGTLSGTFGDLVDMARDATQCRVAAADKETWWWVAPFIRFADATRRTNDDVEVMGAWFGLDLDNGNWHIDQLRGKLFGLTWCIWTTTQSTPDAQRWRILVATDREHTPDERARLFKWFNDKFGGNLCANTNHAARIFYLPASWDGEPPVFEVSYGRPVNVDSVLALVPPEIIDQPFIPDAQLRRAPDGTPIVTPKMIAMAQGEAVGGRLFRLLCRAATRFRRNGWTLSDGDLANAGLSASNQFAHGKARPDILREAQRAITWAERNHPVLTPLDRIRERIRWESAMHHRR